MRVITAATNTAWRSEVKAGPTRPCVRATVQRAHMRRISYNTANAPGGDYDHERERRGHFANFLFGGDESVHEIRSLKRCTWSRSVEQDVSECTLTILNTDVTPIGTATQQADDFEQPGLFTYNRGDTFIAANRWGYTSETGWNKLLVPDRLVRTYEGYGFDPAVAPGDDPNLYISGTWIIDEVGYDATGNLEVRMRDVGRLLIDAIAFPPVVPWDDYPMAWSKITSEQVEGRDVTGGAWGTPKATATSSNNLYVGAGIVDKPKYVQGGGAVQGHQNNDPLQGGIQNYWLSTGQESTDSFVWWEQEFDVAQDMAAVRLHTFGGPFRVFISLQRGDGKWYGNKKIPYAITTEGVDLGAKIPFVHSERAERGEPFDIILKRKYANVKKVRITFTKLRRIQPSGTYRWRAGLRKIYVYTGTYASLGFATGQVLTPVGNYKDYTDIVKWLCCWAGLYWPERASEDYIKFSTFGPQVHYDYATNDAVLPRGRAWGSFQNTGTAGIADLTADQFDKQPLIDGIQQIRDLTGFSFWFDEAGGVVWRMPNLYSQGNYVTPDHKLPRRGPTRTTDHVVIDENETLQAYGTRLSSRNIRERIFVGDGRGKIGTTVKGYRPVDVGLRRIAGWTDQHFRTNREARVAADMIAARQMFDWRRSKATIWGNPAIQVDDQIRFFERVTNETFHHYVLGISSTLDNEAGTWTYELETHWLGERISDAWVIQVSELDQATQDYLNLQGTVD